MLSALLALVASSPWTSDWLDGRLEGGRAGARLGRSLAAADVNGDGFGDLIVGAPGFDDLYVGEGRVTAYLGSPGGLSATPDWTRYGRQRNAHFGAQVASAGDVNGDGYDDVLVASPAFDKPVPPSKDFFVGALDGQANHHTNEGRVYLFLGSATGLSSLPQRMVTGIERDERFGTALAGAGDVNGDGFDDVLVGAPGKTGGLGALFLFWGSASGMDALFSWIQVGTEVGVGWGTVVGAAGDVNEDGFADLLGSAPGAPACGELLLFLGSALGPGSVPDQTIAERVLAIGPSRDFDANSSLDTLYVGGCQGNQVRRRDFATGANGSLPILGSPAAVAAGDVNGDGLQDLVASAPDFAYGPFQGRAFVYTNRPGLTFAPEASFPIYDGDQAGAGFGEALAAIDVDGDGADELFVAAPNYSDGEDQEGLVRLFPGQAQEITLSLTSYSPLSVPDALSASGDFDDDGFSDLLLGTTVRYGTPSGLSALADGALNYPPSTPCYDAYPSLLSRGDANGDGSDDVLVAFNAGFGCHGGYALLPQRHHLHFGFSMGLPSAPTQTIEGACCYDTATFIGDVNGDGYDDALVEKLYPAETEVVLLGSSGGLGSVPAQSMPAGNLQDGGRYQAVLGGNLNGDAYGDLVLVHYGPAVDIHHGSPSGLVFQGTWTGPSSFGEDTFALILEDLDGDGLDDLLFEDNAYNVGRCITYLGSPSGFARAPQWWEPANAVGDTNPFWNNRVLAVADLDADGHTDLLLEGDRIHRGSASGISRAPAWIGSIAFPPERIMEASDFDADGRVELRSFSSFQWRFYEVIP